MDEFSSLITRLVAERRNIEEGYRAIQNSLQATDLNGWAGMSSSVVSTERERLERSFLDGIESLDRLIEFFSKARDAYAQVDAQIAQTFNG